MRIFYFLDISNLTKIIKYIKQRRHCQDKNKKVALSIKELKGHLDFNSSFQFFQMTYFTEPTSIQILIKVPCKLHRIRNKQWERANSANVHYHVLVCKS